MLSYKTFIGNSLFLLALSSAGCTYETVNEEVEFTDAGDDAMITNSERNAGSGTTPAGKIRARIVNMTMGVSGQQSALNYTLDQAAQTVIQIGIEQSPSANATNGPPNLRATVIWQTSGIGTTRIISIGGGASIVGSCENVVVKLEDFSGAPVDVGEAGYQVSVTAVPGNRGTTSTPPTLVPLLSDATYNPDQTVGLPSFPGTYGLAPQGFVVINVPQNVGIQSLYTTPGRYVSEDYQAETPTNLMVSQFDSAGNVIKFYASKISDGFVPLSPQCNTISLFNANLATLNVDGTSAFVNGGFDVVGTDTNYTEVLKPGMYVEAEGQPESDFVEIDEVVDDTHLVLKTAYQGPTNGTAIMVYMPLVSAIEYASAVFGIDG